MAKPKLRFPEFMDEWEEKTVGTIFEFTNGKAHEQCVDENGKYVIINSKFISTEGKIKKYTNDLICPLKKNDIVMVMSDVPNGRAMSKCFLIQEDDKYTLNQRICGLRTSQNSVFYIHQISRNKYYLKFDNGVSQTNLRKEDVLNCPVFETKDDEQQKIADFLSSVDDLIQTQEDKIAVLEEQKKGIIQKLFNREVRFKADDGSEFPEWEEKGLEQIANIFDGTHQTPEYVNEGIPFVSVEDIDNLYGTNKYITEEAFNKEFKIYPQRGDILMTRIGSIGVAAIITKDIKMAYYVSLALLKLKEKVNTEYLLQYILCEKFQQELWKRTLHIAFPKKINKNEIGKCKVNIPCLEEQQKIADCLSAYDEAIQIKKDKLEVWKEIKKGLLQQMFV